MTINYRSIPIEAEWQIFWSSSCYYSLYSFMFEIFHDKTFLESRSVCYQKGWIGSQRYSSSRVYSGVIHNSQKVEAAQMCTCGWMGKQMWCIRTTEYHSDFQRKGLLTHATKWVVFEDITLSEISQSQKTNTEWFHLCE